MNTTNTAPKMSRSDRRAANVLLAAYGLAPIKEHRAPRARVMRYVVTSWLATGEVWTKVEYETLALARAAAKSGSTDPDKCGIEIADVAPIADPDQALEMYRAGTRIA